MCCRKMKKKFVALVIVCTVVLIFISSLKYFQNEVLMDSAIPFLWSTNISCYWKKSSGILELGAGEWDEALLVPDRCIFLMESTCFGDQGIESAILTPRQACAVESAANMNPGLNIFLLYLSPEFSKDSKKLASVLETYGNIYVRRVYLPAYIKNTPLQKWYKRNLEELLDEETDPKSVSDIVKFLTLWKNGGIFLDLDVIVQKRLDVFSNFAGAEDEENIGRGIFGIDISTDLGRKVARACLEEIKRGFKEEYYWERTHIVSEVLQDLCYREDAEDMTKETCQGFTVYSPEKFFPIPPEDWKYYFYENNSEEIREKIENATIIKTWYDYSARKKVSVKSTTPYNIAAGKYCPIVHKNCNSVI